MFQTDDPTLFPVFKHFGTAGERIDELVVAVAPGLFAIGCQKVGPARKQIARDVLHDDRDAVRVRVERQMQLVIGHLNNCPICPHLVVLKHRRRTGDHVH
jgi:hypothetical protein